jgi:hypothetical protein
MSSHYTCDNETGTKICHSGLFGVNCSQSITAKNVWEGLPQYLKLTIGGGGILVLVIIIVVLVR